MECLGYGIKINDDKKGYCSLECKMKDKLGGKNEMGMKKGLLRGNNPVEKELKQGWENTRETLQKGFDKRKQGKKMSESILR